MLGKKEPVRVATLSTTFAPPDEVELPPTPEEIANGVTIGPIVPVRAFDAIGYELMALIESDPNQYGERIWELVRDCLPTVSEDRIKRLTPAECGVITLVASGRIREVQALAKKMAGNAEAPTTAEPESPRSSTLSDSSASTSPEAVAAG